MKNCNKYCPGANFVLEHPTLEALNAVAYTYFDTRPTPLARVNVFDMNNSPMMKNRILQVPSRPLQCPARCARSNPHPSSTALLPWVLHDAALVLEHSACAKLSRTESVGQPLACRRVVFAQARGLSVRVSSAAIRF